MSSFPDEIIARRREDRPDELLVDHAEAVADRTAWVGRFDEKSTGEQPSGTDVARCLGWLHDFGKVAPAFQQYVRGEYPNSQPRRYTYHARLGAFAVYYALGEMETTERDRLAAWAAVLSHHGRLPDFAEQTLRTVKNERPAHKENRRDWACPQIKHTQSHEPSRTVAATLLDRATDGTASWDEFTEAFESGALLDDLADTVGEGKYNTSVTSERLPDDLYDRTTRLWSSLTFADKTAAGEIERADITPQPLALDPLEAHIESLQPESDADGTDIEDLDPTDEASLNILRETARQRVKANAPKLVDTEVGTLTLPTGLGKTFTGITGAFELRDALADRQSAAVKPTVVYALPYTSIIEQTRDHFEDEAVFDADPRTNEFTVHHYLAETVTYADGEDDEHPASGAAETDAPWSKAELLGESWRSGVVLTTFVQLFESLAGPTNAQGLKLPALRNAVVVLDEPQALPVRWWDAVKRLARLLVDEYDARIISMTATQPTLFTDGTFDTLSLVDAPRTSGEDDRAAAPSEAETATDAEPGQSFERRAAEAVARVRYDIHESVTTATEDDGVPISHADAAAELVTETRTPDESDGGRSVLAVCNTIGSSRELTDCLKTEFRATGQLPTHVGATYESVLKAVDTEANELPNHEELTARTLRKLGFAYDAASETWVPGDGASGRAYVGTFNSRYRPLDRRVLIRVSDALATAGVPFVLVSTQAIEAGVDISFARAYRDIAPLDSVVQTAGRCNRSFEWGPENGAVTVWMLDAVDDDEDNPTDESERKPPSRYVYDGSLLTDAAEILLDLRDDTGTLSSVTLERDAVPQYFAAVDAKPRADEALVDYIDDSDAETLGRQSLITKNYETTDVLVAVTETDRERLNDLGAAFGRHPSEGFEALSDLADLRVSIPVRDLETCLPNHVRADHSTRTDGDGVDVFVHRGNEGGGAYRLDGGGFISDDDGGPSSRFTI